MMDGWWLVPVAYLVGSIPWGIIAVRLARRTDVRSHGSGKTGVTNVLRAAGRGPALLTLMGDTGKGVVVVLAARLLSDNTTLHATVAGVAVAGHVWPLWAGFHGGRGIATGVGVVSALEPLAGLTGIAVFAPVVALTRYVSLGSLCSMVGVVIFFGIAFAVGREPLPYFLFSLAIGALIVVMHRDNVQRLLTRTERRLGERTASGE